MSNRIRQARGAYVPGHDGDPGHFVVVDVPLAPTTTRELVVDPVKRIEVERVGIYIACPNCMKNVDIRYDAIVAPMNFAEQLARTLEREHDRRLDAALEQARRWTREVGERDANQRQQLVVERQLDAMAEWYS